MKQMEPPKCRLCEKNHWAREGCYGMLMNNGAAVRPAAGVNGKPPHTVNDLRRDMAATPGNPKGRQPATSQSGAPGLGREGLGNAGLTTAPLKNTSREGRRVLKGSTGKASPAKPTRTASTERADPCTPAKASADKGQTGKARRMAPPKPDRGEK